MRPVAQLELTPGPVVHVHRLIGAIGARAGHNHRAGRRRDEPSLAEQEAQGVDQVHTEVEHRSATSRSRTKPPRDGPCRIQVAPVEAARPPMANLADGSFADECARLHDRRLVAQYEPGLAGQVDVERMRGERLGLLARAPDGFLEVERPVGVEHLARLGRVAVVSARDVHQLQLVVRKRLLEGLDHAPHAKRLGFVAHRRRPLGDDRRHDRKHGSGPHHG